jgi:hypothetical protein
MIFGCKKSESTSPTPQVPKYSIRAGDRWVFQVNNSNDSLVLIAKSETTLTINNKSSFILLQILQIHQGFM